MLSAYTALVRCQRILEQASSLTGISAAELTGNRKTPEVVDVRHAAALAMSEAGAHMSLIGRVMGGRDHSTVRASIEVAQGYQKREAEYAALIGSLVASASA